MAPPVQPPMDLGSWIARRAAATPQLPAITFYGHTVFGASRGEAALLRGC